MLDTVVGGQGPGSRKTPPPAAAPGRGSSRSADQGATVLIIEDDAIIAMAMAEELGESGFAVVGPAVTGPEAIELAERHRPDLIIVDVRLHGEMNGIVAARRIKESLATRVVFASAHIDGATRAAMETVGYDAIVAKPYTPEQIASVVRDVLGD